MPLRHKLDATNDCVVGYPIAAMTEPAKSLAVDLAALLAAVRHLHTAGISCADHF
jgi:hypothetical protein